MLNMLTSKIVSAIQSAFKSGAAAQAKARIGQDKAIQVAVDHMIVACTVSKVEFLKGNAATNPHRKEVKGLFDGLAEAGWIGESAARNYATSFWIAFESGKPFQRDAFQEKKPESKGKGKSPTTSKVIVNDRANLDTAIEQVIQIAMAMGLSGFVADLKDLVTDSLA